MDNATSRDEAERVRANRPRIVITPSDDGAGRATEESGRRAASRQIYNIGALPSVARARRQLSLGQPVTGTADDPYDPCTASVNHCASGSQGEAASRIGIADEPYDPFTAPINPLASKSQGGASSGIPSASVPQGDLIHFDEQEQLHNAIRQFNKTRRRIRRQEKGKMSTDSSNQSVDSVKTTPEMPSGTPKSAKDREHGADDGEPTPRQSPVRHVDSTPSQTTTRRLSQIVCVECNSDFSSVLALWRHQMDQEHNYCSLCYSFFLHRNDHRRHVELAHNFGCVECGEIFTKARGLEMHQRKEEHGFCVACDCFFKSKESKNRHAMTFHKATKSSGCDETRDAESKGATQPK